MEIMGKAVESFSSKYDNFLITGDFSTQVNDIFLKDFSDTYSFKHLIKEPTYYKNPC